MEEKSKRKQATPNKATNNDEDKARGNYLQERRRSEIKTSASTIRLMMEEVVEIGRRGKEREERRRREEGGCSSDGRGRGCREKHSFRRSRKERQGETKN